MNPPASPIQTEPRFGYLGPRPPIQLTIVRVSCVAWALFAHHHYLNQTINSGAQCFVAYVTAFYGHIRPVAFTAVIHSPGKLSFYREHRTVTLPDFQGVGIGNALSEFVASLYSCKKEFRSTTSNPAMVHHRARSPLWAMIRPPGLGSAGDRNHGRKGQQFGTQTRTRSVRRLTASFKYIGPTNERAARGFGII